MPEKYYLIKILTNTAGQDSSSIAVYNDETSARVAYHQMLGPLHNASDVLYAIVQIVEGEYANLVVREIVDHRPEPEPNEEEE